MKSPPRQLWPPQWYIFSLQGMTWRTHKVPKIKKILPYEMKFLVPNYSCLQNTWLGGFCPQTPILSVLCPQLNLLTPPKQNSWVRHCILLKHEMQDNNKLNQNKFLNAWLFIKFSLHVDMCRWYIRMCNPPLASLCACRGMAGSVIVIPIPRWVVLCTNLV